MSNINVNNLTPLLGSGSSVSVSGSLVVKNDVTIGGHLYIGDQDTDSVTFSAEVSSSVVPDANVTYDLGSSAKRWKDIYLNSLVTHHITASGNISASGTGTNGTGSFHHVATNGNITASGTGSFEGGVIANNATGSFGYVSSSGDISASGDIYGVTGSFAGGIDCIGDGKNATGSFGYISASGDISTSADLFAVSGTFEGGVSCSDATGSFGQVTADGDISSSGTGSFMDVFIDDNLEVQGVTNLHGNISSSNTVTASFGYVSSSGNLSASGVGYFAGGVETDVTSTGSFGYVSASGDVSAAGTVYTTTGVVSEGNISSSAGLLANTVQMAHNGVNTLTVTNAGAVSASSTIQGTALTLQDAGINTLTVDSAGALSASSTLAGTALTLATNGVNALTVAANGNLSSSGTLAGTTLTLGDTGVNVATVDALGNISGSGTGSFVSLNVTDAGTAVFNVDTNGHVSASGRISSSAGLLGTQLTLATNGVNAFDVSAAGALSASSTLAGTALDIRTAGVQKAVIDANGTGSFFGGIDCIGDGKNATGSFGHISMSGGDISGAANIHLLSQIIGPGNKAILEASATDQTLGNTGLVVGIGGTQINLNASADGITVTGSISASHAFDTVGSGSFGGGLTNTGHIHSTGQVYAPFYRNYHAITNAQTLTTTSSGVPIVVTNDSTVTLPAVAIGVSFWIINGNADGTKITVSPDANDKFLINAAGATGTDDKDCINTAATSRKGDYLKITYGSGDGWTILERAGQWADES